MVTIVIMWASAMVACVAVVSAGLLRRWPLLALARLLAKLGARDRVQLVIAAYQAGLVSPDGPPTPPRK